LQILNRILSQSKVRNNVIVSEVIKALNAGRKVIVFSALVEHLYILDKIFEARRNELTVKISKGFLCGELHRKANGQVILKRRSEYALKKAMNADLTWATYQMAKDALDMPSKDVGIMATPIGDPRQAVGRIIRRTENKKTPIWVDLIDSKVNLCLSLFETRQKYYSTLDIIKASELQRHLPLGKGVMAS